MTRDGFISLELKFATVKSTAELSLAKLLCESGQCGQQALTWLLSGIHSNTKTALK